MECGSDDDVLKATASEARRRAAVTAVSSDDDSVAASQLSLRRVKYVVTDAPERVIATSAALLGVPAPPQPLIVRLASGRDIPDFLQPVFANQFFRVYKVRDE